MTTNSPVAAREDALVDAQVLLQTALNNKFGNPRDYEESDPEKTKQLFKLQRRLLKAQLGWSKQKVKQLFADDAKLTVKDLAEALHVLGYNLEFKMKKRKS